METVEAIYENGKIKFLDKNLPRRKFRVLVTFLEEVEAQTKPEKKMTGKEFVEKWRGVLKGANIKDYKEERLKYLEEKHLK